MPDDKRDGAALLQSLLDAGKGSVTAMNVDLSDCDRELIHIPGLIQPHGVMLVLRPADRTILQASENTATLFGVAAPDLHLKSLTAVFGAEQAAGLDAAIGRAGDRLNNGPLLLLRLPAAPAREAFDAIAHRVGEVLILELEQIAEASAAAFSFETEMAHCVARLQATTSLGSFLERAVIEIKACSGFDRVMAYRFDVDGSGDVVAEARRSDLNTYIGQRFPASDIPQPARRMFALSRLRHLPNVQYQPLRLLPELAEPVDMSHAILRHVSVMYSSYLKNMRVHSTLVMPLMKGGQLWGLISCMHHAAPLHVPCETRMGLELLAVMISLLMAEKADLDTAAYRQRMQQAIESLVSQMAQQPVYHRGLSGGAVDLNGWLDAAGTALVTESGVKLSGTTPDEEEVGRIVKWLSEHDDRTAVFATNRLSQLYPRAEAFRETASGLLVVWLMRGRPECVIWFRPEVVQTINWAGDPNKPVQVDVVDGRARLTPRGSFDLWKENVSGRSQPWLDCELEAAGVLRRAIAEEVLADLGTDLRRSQAELDTFAYAASHDLKEPLRGIHNFARFLQRSADAKLNDEERGRTETIIRLARRLDELTDSLLEYSRVGRSAYPMQIVDLNEVLKQTLEVLETRIAETGSVVHLPRRFPSVYSSRVPLASVFMNLITNACKYNDHPAGQRQIEIGWRDDTGGRVFYVRDNGIGIAKEHLEHVFRIFRRLHGRDEYGGGTGAGLTIARHMMEQLGGRLWAESDGPGLGTTFLLSFGGTPPEAAGL